MPLMGARGGGSVRGFGRFGAGKPNAPTIDSVTVASTSSVTIAYTLGANNGAPISTINFVSSPSTSLTFTNTDLDGSVTVSATFTQGQAYTFTMTATNAAGTSDASSASSSSTPIPLPTVTGGTLASDATYYYRTFTSNGNLVVSNASIPIDALIVAGGGYGFQCGAGGAGGLRGVTQTLSPATYSAVVGGSTGDSSFNSITSTAGGNGGYNYGPPRFGGNGGSGGGGGTSGGGTGNTPSTTPSQGNNGGNGTTGSYGHGGGGGGAGANGTNASTDSAAGNGGNGSSAYSSWGAATGTGQNIGGTYWYAGGGGGGRSHAVGSVGTGGNGGGGPGSGSGTSNTGTANTGGGGGGTGSLASVNGGSGIVIVRYLRSAVGG